MLGQITLFAAPSASALTLSMRPLRLALLGALALTSACSPPKATVARTDAKAERSSRPTAEDIPDRVPPPAGLRTKARHVALAELNRRLPDADQRQIEGVAIQNTYPDGREGLTVVIVYRDTDDCVRSPCQAIVTTDAQGEITGDLQLRR
jgi:hypothetical protein